MTLEFSNNHNYQDPRKINKIILHHSAGHATVEQVHEMHKKRGWAGIGYHYYITTDGVVHEGRPVDMVGSHCRGNNTGSIGICLEGNFTIEKPTAKQLASLKSLVRDLRKKHPSIRWVFNHNDLDKTTCPAVNLKGMI